MRKLFHRLSSSRSFAKLFSMHAQLEERRRAMFSKSSVCAVVALAASMSLGALLFPHVGHAQEGCVWDCDLGSDINDFPWGNSPQSQLDIAYCIDRDCVIQNITPIIGFITSTDTNVGLNQTANSNRTNGGNTDVTISGPVVAGIRDKSGNVLHGYPAHTQMSRTIKCV